MLGYFQDTAKSDLAELHFWRYRGRFGGVPPSFLGKLGLRKGKGFFLSLIRANRRISDDAAGDKTLGLIAEQAKEKEENKRRILGILETQSPLTNNHIEQLLGISDATATRYLEELEKEGYIRQVGKTGRYVYYERV